MKKLLIANRGEIAVRIARTCRDLGIAVVAVHAADDAGALHVRVADESVELTGSGVGETYLDIEQIVAAAQRTGADAVHPGYGFLAENGAFADAVRAAGLTFIGPSGEAIRQMGDKIAARAIATAAGVPLVPGTAGIDDVAPVLALGETHGYPVAIKAAAGGGGRGMRVVHSADQAEEAFAAARREAAAAFGDDHVYAERYLAWPRHIEIQVLADRHGNAVALGQRDCSVQRRHQKLVEEAPAPQIAPEVTAAMEQAAVALALEVGYEGAGTVEMLYEDGAFYFLEMNTRLQVEHPVTELVYGVDLVALQVHVADGGVLPPDLVGPPRGHAIELRINAEDPAGGRFLPSPGAITTLRAPQGPGVRFDAGYAAGDVVGAGYDNLIGKLILWGQTREEARLRALRVLDEFEIAGVATTVGAHRIVLASDAFAAVEHSTRWLESDVDLSGLEAAPAASTPDDDGAGAAEDELWVAGRPQRIPPILATVGTPVAASAAVRRASEGGGARVRAPRRTAADGHNGRRQSAAAVPGAVVAPLQGVVGVIAVSAGDVVSAGDRICIVEAMKMENEVIAPRAGTVSEIRATSGQSVAAGDVLAIVEPSEQEA